MIVTRRCLKIPFVISATNEAAIIGNSCVDNPVWEVPCTDVDLDGVDCGTIVLTEPVDKTLVLA